jgi:outer membrane protein
MRRLMFPGVVLGFLLVWGVSARAAENQVIAFLDAQKVLDETKAGQQAKKEMEEYRDSRQKIIDMEEREIKTLQDELARQQTVLGPEARKVKEEKLQRKLFAYQQRVGEFSRELEDKKRDVLIEFNKGLIEAVEKIAKNEGYTFVFDRNAEGGVLLYAREAFDITDKVIGEYDQSAP